MGNSSKSQKIEFWGRSTEIAALREWDRKSSRLAVLYGRRRVGKTRLVEEAFAGERMLTIEGVEGGGQAEQLRVFLDGMSEFLNRPELNRLGPRDWISILSLLSESLGPEPCVVFLDEFPWLASERGRLVSQLKYAWDRFFTKKNRVLLILCGSVSSFMVKRVLRSKALYGRVEQEIHLQPLALSELRPHFATRRSVRELVELYMVVGGIPQYVKMFDLSRSVRLNIDKLCFSPNGYLVNEFDRLFASHFGTNHRYRDILLALARRSWASRDQLKKECQMGSGGRISEYLDNLQLAGFIESYAPIDRPHAVRNLRYRLSDQYIMFYFKFIHHKRLQINRQRGSLGRAQVLPDRQYESWRGLAFERICYLHRREIAAQLGFGAVSYEAGSWFAKGEQNLKTQIDLLFVRADNVITLCEIKFTEAKVGMEVIKDVRQKIAILPNPRGYSVERVLISSAEPTSRLRNEGYFHAIVGLDALF